MALQGSGAISYANLQSEFGGGHPITMSEYYGRASGIPGSGQISMNQFHGTVAVQYVSISMGTNFVLTSQSAFSNLSSSYPIHVTLSGSAIGSSTGNWAFKTGNITGYNHVTLVINGSIKGYRGTGGGGRNNAAGYGGGAGGPAMYIQSSTGSSNLTIDNNSSIYGGGGGGGGGGGFRILNNRTTSSWCCSSNKYGCTRYCSSCTNSGSYSYASGGNGGYGYGYANNPNSGGGGASLSRTHCSGAVSGTAGSGGTGGGAGAAGNGGGSSTWGGGAGGTRGIAIQRNGSNISWSGGYGSYAGTIS